MESSVIKNVNVIEQLYKNIHLDAQKTEKFLRTQDDLAERQVGDSKLLYDLGRSFGVGNDVLPELIVGGFDIEQIWQQIELTNKNLEGKLKKLKLNIVKSVNAIEKKRKISAGYESEVQSKKVRFEDDSEEDEVQSKRVKSDDDELDEEINEVESDDGSDVEDNELKALLKKVKENEANGENDDEDSADDEEIDADDDGDDDEEDDGDEEAEEDDPMEKFKEALRKGKGNKTSKSEISKKTSFNRQKDTELEDGFLKLSDMDQFLDRQDLKEQKRRDGEEDHQSDDDDEIDIFKDSSSDEESADPKYADFFDAPDHADLEDDVIEEEDGDKEDEDKEDEDNEVDEAGSEKLSEASEVVETRELIPDPSQFKSSFEERKKVLNRKISELEESNLTEKPWQLKGEVGASSRPENSLMEEVLDFETTTKPATLITEEFTKTIEEKIIQRLKDNIWDGPKRKVKTKESAFTLKKKKVPTATLR